MPNQLEYRKSISRELISIKDRVRNFIDSRHWGEDGRYKEIILMETLKNYLPKNITVATGFVMAENNQISTQIDIIVYRNDYPILFKISDFAVVPKESVVAIVEVKSNLSSRNIRNSIKKSHDNGELIGKHIFNGIFGYETDCNFNLETDLNESITSALRDNNQYLNHICFGKDYFMRYWDNGNPRANNQIRSYSFYEIEDLAFGYFISNLIEKVYELTHLGEISGILRSSLYPIEDSKEAHRIEHFEILLNNYGGDLNGQ